jgi:hypothetical protein
MTLRTLGRGHWIGIVGSVALHAALLSTGSFQVPQTRADDSGAEGVHLWLSQEKHFLPARISYFDDDGKEWILRAVDISLE